MVKSILKKRGRSEERTQRTSALGKDDMETLMLKRRKVQKAQKRMVKLAKAGELDPKTGVSKEFEKANSSTHKKEYLQFLRQSRNRKKCPKDLDLSDKEDMFRKWFPCDAHHLSIECNIHTYAYLYDIHIYIYM